MIPRTPWCPGQSMHGAERLSSEPPAVKDASRLVKSLSRGLWVCFPGGLGLAGGGGVARLSGTQAWEDAGGREAGSLWGAEECLGSVGATLKLGNRTLSPLLALIKIIAHSPGF